MFSCILAVILAVFTCVFVFTDNLQDTMEQQAYSQTMLLMHILETSREEPVETLEKIKSEIYGRITFVDAAGRVVYDSDYNVSELGSHADRDEIVQAMTEGISMGQRMSTTANRITYYCAARVGDKGVIRVGVMSATLATDAVLSTSPYIWTFILGFMLIIFILSSFTTNRIVDTIEKYDLDKGEGEIYEELSHFVTRIKSQNDIIKRQLQTLTDEKLKLQSIFMNIKEGILVCDSKKHIVQTNREARDILNLTYFDTNFVKVVRIPQLQEAVDKAIKGETVHTVFDWNGRWYQGIVSQNIYGGDVGAMLFILDITQQIENESNRRQFTDNVTHELKTPLTSIIGYSQLITNDIARPEDIKGFVGIIEKNAENLMEMINDIIKISNLETGASFVKVPLQLDEIVSTAIAQEKLSATNRNITINARLEKIQIMADESQMYQLAHNLISNAIKYNRENGRVDIVLQKDGKFALLEVKDTGIGIPKEYLDKIFERFYVVDKSRNKKISSTGLGLSIVKHVVIAHDGKIDVKSEPGQGSQFTVRLPME
ncbi:MAG: hypothetical protein IJ362_04010 [Oscillospiraceae bacterium]|nr:hypothetical protein [Oscillospiraceae bacterium]